MSLIECYVHTVVSGLGGQIGHIAGAVAVVPTIDGRLAWTLDGHSQTALSSATCVDHKLCRLPDNTTLQSRAKSMYFIGITAREALQPEGTWRNWCAAKANTQQILAQLSGRKVDQKSFRRRYNMGLNTIARGTGDGHRQIRLGQAVCDNTKLLQTVQGRGLWMNEMT